MQSKIHYFLAPVEIKDHEQITLSLSRALISLNGVYRVFEESEIAHSAFLDAKTFIVKIEDNILHGRLVREQGIDGAHYNLHIIHTCEDTKSIVSNRIKKIGFESPWKREYPRIPMKWASKFVEVPAFVVFPRTIGHADGEVVNYSHHGLLFEFLSTGISLGEYVGQKIQFELITNRGERLGVMEAKVTRIYDEMISPGKLIRGLGVKFLSLPEPTLKRYQELILDVCKVAIS